jgi:hypothetical protein
MMVPMTDEERRGGPSRPTRPEPAPNSPLARPPHRPAKPEYDQRGITPDDLDGYRRKEERR